jgi:uncharacterized protein (DUF1330 family)
VLSQGFAAMSRCLAVLLALLPFASAATETALDTYMRLQIGSFTTEQQAKQDTRYDTAIWHIAEIWPGREQRARWLYSESWLEDAKRPYMQRVSRLTLTRDGSIRAERFSIPQPERFVGAWQEATRFAALRPRQLERLAGCDTILTRTANERFEGGTSGAACTNDYKGASYAVSQTVVDAEGMRNWDRGFNASGTQVWGPAYGAYRFRRVGAEVGCSEPVRMLVYGEISDRARFGAYMGAIRSSNLYAETGGVYEAISPALEVFEGEPPADRGVVMVRFPCREAARRFWYSPRYAEIRKLRDGAARFEVLLLGTPPAPAWAKD